MKLRYCIRTVLLFALFGVTTFALLGCDSGGSNEASEERTDNPVVEGGTFSVTEGSFTATITKDGTEATVSGGALFGVGSEASFLGDEAFVVYMLSGKKMTDGDGSVSGTWTEVMIRDRQDPVVPSQNGPDPFTGWDMNSIGAVTGFFSGNEGTLDITGVSDTELSGDFSLTLFDDVAVTGSFTANPSDVMNQVVCAPDC